jgi:hypothetical protein
MQMSDKIYHYTKRSTALEKILPTMKLRFNNIGNTNDPRETKETLLSIMTSTSDEYDLSDIFWKTLEERALHIRNNEFKLISFSEHAPDIEKLTDGEIPSPYMYGYNRSRMWAQYAENNSGICLEFNKDALIRRIQSDLKKQDQKVFHGRMNYDDYKSLAPRTIEFSGRRLEEMDEIIREHIIKHYKGIFFYKSTDWHTEFEYRWILHCNDYLSEHFVSISDSLTSIIVGPDFPEVYEPSLISTCQGLKIPIGRLRWESGWPRLIRTAIYEPE